MKKWCMLLMLMANVCSATGQHSSTPYFIEPSKLNNELLQNTIHGLAKDSNGMLWTVTQFGCYRYDGFNTKLYLVSNTPFLQSDRYRYLLQDHVRNRLIVVGDLDYYFIDNSQLKEKKNKDSILIASNSNFLLLPRQKLEQHAYFKNKNLINASILFFKTDTLIVMEDKLFNLTRNEFVAKPNLTDPMFSNLVYKNGQQYAVNKNGIYALTFNKEKILKKLLLPLSGFYHLIPGNNEHSIWIENEHEIKKIKLPSLNFEESISIKSEGNISQSILEDETSGTIYWGTVKKGIYLLRQNKINKMVPENYTHSYCYNNKLQSYCITTNKGIAFSNPSKKTTINCLPQKNIRNYFIYNDAQQRIWFQNESSTILILDPNTNQLFDTIPFYDYMVLVKQLDEQRFIIGNHQTIFLYETNTKKRDTIFNVSHYQSINGVTIHHNQIYIACNDGLWVLNWQKQVLAHYLSGIALRKSIGINNHLLALGSYGSGLFLLKNNKIYKASTETHPQLNAVTMLSMDDEGALWVISNKAVFIWKHLDVVNEAIPPPDYVLQVEKDLPCNELNGGLMPDTFPNHEIALPSSDGLLIFKKQHLILKPFHSMVSISKILIGDRSTEKLTAFDVAASSPEMKVFIDAADLEYNYKDKIVYRLKELDSNWYALPEKRMLSFSRLPPGKYHLEIRQNNELNSQLLCFFSVMPFWYQTTWAYLFFILATTALLSLIVQFRIRQQKLYQKKLEAIIDEKTKSLQENISRLHFSEKELKRQHRYRNKLYSILMHDLKSPLTFLSNYSIQQLGPKKTVEKEAMQVIAKSSSELASFINEFLFWLGKQTNPDKMDLKRINLSELLFEQTEFYQSFAGINNNRIFYFEREKELYITTDAERLKIIVRNLLDNANKYTTNGIIKISHTTDNENHALIFIEDTGKGIPENIIQLINNPLPPEGIAASINANHKMGLMISKELIGKIGGSITAVSNENNGTKFTIILASKIHTR